MKYEHKEAAVLWSDWTQKVAVDAAEIYRSNQARAQRFLREGVVRGLKELQGRLQPNGLIEFRDGSVYPAEPIVRAALGR